MKKIVAIVLSLVMVLGLATTAFAAQKTTTYQGLYGKDATGAEMGDVIELAITTAKAPTYNKTTGALELAGEMEHAYITMNGVVYGPYEMVASLADLSDANDIVLYKDAAYKVAVYYLNAIPTEEYVEGTVFTNFGEDCGEVEYLADEESVYYTVKGDAAGKVYEADAVAGDMFIKVGASYVKVNSVYVADKTDVVAHAAVYTTKNGVVESIECGACGLKAVKVANALSMAKDADVVAGETVWYWPAAAQAPAASDKVESAQTFDAGIAMYVGMSVMAAAGSAVVLKKKD